MDSFDQGIGYGLLYFIFPPYALYFACFEFDHIYKWPIVITAIIAPILMVGWVMIIVLQASAGA